MICRLPTGHHIYFVTDHLLVDVTDQTTLFVPIFPFRRPQEWTWKKMFYEHYFNQNYNLEYQYNDVRFIDILV